MLVVVVPDPVWCGQNGKFDIQRAERVGPTVVDFIVTDVTVEVTVTRRTAWLVGVVVAVAARI